MFPECKTILSFDILFSIWLLRERWKSWYWRFELTIAIEPSWKGVPCNVRCSVFVLFVCVRLCICIRHTWIYIWLKREKNKIDLRKYLSWPLPLNRRDRAFPLPQTQASKAANFEHRKNYQSPLYRHFFKLLANYCYRKNGFWNYRKIIDIENRHPISSDKHCPKNKSKRVLHIPNKYECVFDISAQPWAAILAEHLLL